MRAAFRKEIRKTLEGRRNQILSGVGEVINGDLQKELDNLPDPADVATNETDQSFSVRVRERERKLLAKIEEALQNLEKGTYGVCESCGEEISEGRLRARPVTTLCIRCKEEQEEQERREAL